MRIERLVWDGWNREHIGKHDMTIEYAEDVVSGPATFGRTYKGRIKVIGPTSSGRVAVVIVGPVPGSIGDDYYVFSARLVSRKERRQYGIEMGGDVS